MDKILILTYHAVDNRSSVTSVSPGLFRWQMESLADLGLRGINLAEAFRHFRQTGKFPESSVVLTFDDAYTCLLDPVFPLLQSLGFSATVFAIAGLIGLDTAEARLINADIKRDLLGWAQLETLLQSGFEIGSHGFSHARLTKLPGEALERELSESQRDLEDRLQTPVDSVAYPYGDFDPTVRVAASKYYRYGCTTDLGRVGPDTDPLQLDRVDVYYLKNRKIFSEVCSGGLEGYLNMRQYLRQIRKFTGSKS